METNWKAEAEALAEKVLALQDELDTTKVLLEDAERAAGWYKNELDLAEAKLEIVYLIFGGERGMSDLISREALARKFLELILKHLKETDIYDFGREVADEIKNAPAVDAAKVAHGKWEIVGNPIFDDDVKVSCSMCSWIFDDFYNYCPNCGTDMRNGE